jgi:hypothetical protein
MVAVGRLHISDKVLHFCAYGKCLLMGSAEKPPSGSRLIDGV